MRFAHAPLFFLALPIVAACSGAPVDGSNPDLEASEEAPSPIELRGKIGPGGGELVADPGSPLAGVRLVIPEGALASDVDVVVAATIDPVPLAQTAERVGAQVTVRPAGLVLAKPARLTVPFDPSLRAAFADRDDECKVWVRAGDGWSMAEPLSSSAEGTTIEIASFTTAAAGVRIVPRPLACELTRTCPTAEPTCLDGNALCMTKLRPPTVAPFETASLSVENGFLYFVHAPAPDTFTIAKVDLLSTTSKTTLFRALSRPPSGPVSQRGRIAVDASDNAMVGLVGYGNLEFRADAEAVARDTSPSLQPAGVVVDPRDRTSRVRLTRRSEGQGFALFGLGGGNLAKMLDLAPDEIVFARSKSHVENGADPFLVMGTRHGVSDFAPGTPLRRRDDVCGNGISVNADGGGPARFTACASGVVGADGFLTRYDGTIGSMAIDDTGGTWVTDPTRAELVKVMPNSIENDTSLFVRFPLTAAPPGSPEHARMLPRAIRFERGTRSLVLVTRGQNANGIPDLYSIAL